MKIYDLWIVHFYSKVYYNIASYNDTDRQTSANNTLADVELGKQITEITASSEGAVKILYYREDETCWVGDLLSSIET